MSVLKVSAIKNNSASSNNLVLNTDGSLSLGTGGDLVANNSLNTRLGGFVSNNYFADNAGGSLGPKQIDLYTSGSGNYTVPSDANYVVGVAIGGGGGGGGNSTSGQKGAAGGPGAATYFSVPVTPSSTVAYSVGAAGNDGVDGGGNFGSGTNGGAGGSTTFGSNVTSSGGNGGQGGAPNNNTAKSAGNSGNGTGNHVSYVAKGTEPPNQAAGSSAVTPGGAAASVSLGVGALVDDATSSTLASSVALTPGAGNGGDSSTDGTAGLLVVLALG